MNDLSINFFSSEKIFNFIIYISFGFIPFSFILGNTILNSNIIICCILLITQSIKYHNWEWLKNKLFIYLLIIWFYLIFNSLFAIAFKIDHEHVTGGLIRSLGYIKFVIFSCTFFIFKNKDIKFEKVINIWFVLILIILIDVFFEKIFGKNIVGNISPDHSRIVSFFKNELVVGGFLFCFGFISTAYIFAQKSTTNNKKNFLYVLLFIILIAIFLTGERSNFIKSFIFLISLIFVLPADKLIIKKKYLFVTFLIVIITTLSFNKNINQKYFEFFDRINISKGEGFDKFENIKYFSHYKVSINIFKDNIFLGVGNKNFRWSCHDEKYFDESEKFTLQRCSTHPHQIHFEILSEQGLIGYLLFFSLIIKFIFYCYNNKSDESPFFKKILCIYLIIFLIPLLPSGSIFSSFNGSYFWLVLSILNYINKKN